MFNIKRFQREVSLMTEGVRFNPVRKKTNARDEIADQIVNQILLGYLKPDSPLPSEHELMKQFGTSRGTLREALRIVEASGLITIKQGARGGTTVSSMTDTVISDFLYKAFRLGSFSFDDVFQLRLALEPFIAASVASAGIEPKLLAELEKNISEVKSPGVTNEQLLKNHEQFHIVLAMATGNSLFSILVTTMMKGIEPDWDNLSRQHPDSPEHFDKITHRSVDYHARILEAIKEGNSNRAREEMYQHLFYGHDSMCVLFRKLEEEQGNG
jgi:DNA-binding FadR family transcriptional regulator